MKLKLLRIDQSLKATLGWLYVDGRFFCCTLELPDLDNQKQVSCVPEGVYKCVPHSSQKYRDVWRLENVPNREAILIHAGNTTSDILGCILVGTKHGVLRGKPAVLNSRIALNKLRELASGKEFELTITSKKG
jgi:hypothetical protein